MADAKFPAFVAARTRAPGVSHAPEEVRGFLAPYSVELLPVAADVKSKLRRFGLHTMGEVAAMEEHLIVAQFGRDGSRLWALCNGIDDSPVVPWAFEESIVEEISLPFNSTSIELLLVAVDTLLRRGLPTLSWGAGWWARRLCRAARAAGRRGRCRPLSSSRLGAGKVRPPWSGTGWSWSRRRSRLRM